jgi:hypothetical protein
MIQSVDQQVFSSLRSLLYISDIRLKLDLRMDEVW